MSDIRFEEIPVAYPVEGGALGREIEPPFGTLYDPIKRRTFVQGAVALGTVAGLTAMGLFGTVRKARADHNTWNEWDGCGGVNYNGTCAEPCYGFAPDRMGTEFCVTCDELANVSHNLRAWHYNGFRPWNAAATHELRDLPGRICPGPGANRDAWNWNVNNCGGCATLRFRCHDGMKREVGGSFYNTICAGQRQCNGNPINCP